MEYVAHDLVRVWNTEGPSRSLDSLVTVLYRGDGVDVLERAPALTKVRLDGRDGWIRGNLRTTAKPLLAFAFIDVGQGDACLITTPSGHRLLIDGGENQLAARYLAARFWSETSAGKDVAFDALIVTHGDADHFDGLSKLILDAADETRERKRIRVTAARVFHNGLVRRPSSTPEQHQLGPTVDVAGRPFVPLVQDPRSVSDPNRPFARWNQALDALGSRSPTTVSRLDTAVADAFQFLEDVDVRVLGPHVHLLDDGSGALPLLGDESGHGISASRTINGHSIVLKVTYGNVTALLTGDTHAAAQESLRQQGTDLRADIFKVPHHGSEDVSRAFIEAVQPLISVISAGDEDARRDYLHPRANLLAMLGQSRRGAEPVVLSPISPLSTGGQEKRSTRSEMVGTGAPTCRAEPFMLANVPRSVSSTFEPTASDCSWSAEGRAPIVKRRTPTSWQGMARQLRHRSTAFERFMNSLPLAGSRRARSPGQHRRPERSSTTTDPSGHQEPR